MKIYLINDYVSGYYAAFDSEEKMNDFIKKEKIKWIKNLGEDYIEGEDYNTYIIEINKGWSMY